MSQEGNSNITSCPDCGGKVSLRASACPHCGAPTEPRSSQTHQHQSEGSDREKKGRSTWRSVAVLVLVAGVTAGVLSWAPSWNGDNEDEQARPVPDERRAAVTLDELDRVLRAGLEGKSCGLGRVISKEYPVGAIGVSAAGVLNSTVQTWQKGKMTNESAVSVPISGFSSISRDKSNECYIVNLKCNRYFIDSKGRLSKCVGETDHLDLYFPSNAAATEFENVVETFLSPQVVPENSRFARIPDGRVVVQPPGAEGWVLKEGNALGGSSNAIVIEPHEELVMTGSATSVGEISDRLSKYADGISCKFKGFLGPYLEKNKPGNAITVDANGVIARHYVYSIDFKLWNSIDAAAINNLDIAAATLEGDTCLQLEIPCRRNLKPGARSCVVNKTNPADVNISPVLKIPVDSSASLGELKQALISLSASFAPPAKSSRDDGEPARPNTSTNQDFIERGKKVAEQHIAKLERQQKELIRKMQNSFNQECHVKWTNCWKTEDGVWMYQTSDKKHWYWEDGSLVQKDNWPYGPNYSAIRSDDSG